MIHHIQQHCIEYAQHKSPTTLMLGTKDAKHTPEDCDEVAWVTRCPVNPRADGVATHAEHPAQPVRTAAAVTTLRRGAIVNE